MHKTWQKGAAAKECDQKAKRISLN